MIAGSFISPPFTWTETELILVFDFLVMFIMYYVPTSFTCSDWVKSVLLEIIVVMIKLANSD